MVYLFLSLGTLFSGVGNVIGEAYNKRVKTVDPFCYTLIVSLVVFVFYFCYGGFSFAFDATTILYAVFFGISYCICNAAMISALKVGYVSLTSLVISYSLILPTLFGIITYDNKVSAPFAIGLILLAVSLFFLGKKRNSEKEEKSVSIKWLIFVLLAFVANGTCSILQTHQQRKCAGNFKSEFMMVAMAIVFLFCLVTIAINFKRNKEVLSINVKKGWWIAVLYALCNALLNLSVLLSVGKISPGIVFPVICGGGLILALILSEIVFKEKLSSFQYVGFAMGVLSIVLLNI